MKRIECFCFCFGIIIGFISNAQRINLKGHLIASDEVEGLHILNKTALKYTISNKDGSFIIPAKISDTLVISGVKYQVQDIFITKPIIEAGILNVELVESVNELREVIVGTILTGSLQSDLENSDAKTDINFYDLGIPGYTGKPLTLNERKLHDADAGPMGGIMGGPYGGGVGLNFHKLLNKISGRTKKLKAIVELDDKENCIQRLRRDYESFLFEKDTLATNLRSEYFHFCREDKDFLSLCEVNNEIELLEFLQKKLKTYQEIRQSVLKN